MLITGIIITYCCIVSQSMNPYNSYTVIWLIFIGKIWLTLHEIFYAHVRI